jgi:hypothetical protein
VNIAYIYSENDADWVRSEWRCKMPFRALNQTRRHKAFLLDELEFHSKTIHSNEICEKSDVLIIQNNLWGEKLAELQHWQAKGKNVIVDLDAEDFVNAMKLGRSAKKYNPEKYRLELIEDYKLSKLVQFQWGLQLVNGATTPSQKLVEDWNQFTQIEVLLDYIDIEKYNNAPYLNHEDIVIGWTGKKDQLKYLKKSGLLEMIKEVCLVRPKVKFMICCDTLDCPIKPNLPANQFIYRRIEKLNWPKPISTFDIALVPLISEMDQYRGRSSILEYLIMKVPWIGSKCTALYDLRKYGWLVENENQLWKDLLLDMIDHISDYKIQASRESYLYGIGQNIHENIQHLPDTYVKIMGNTQVN